MSGKPLKERTNLSQVLVDVSVWVSFVLVFLAFRVVMIGIFHSGIQTEHMLRNVFRCLGRGLRFDISIATFICIPLVLVMAIGGVAYSKRVHAWVRQAVLLVFSVVCSIIFVVDVPYFAEYHNQFDHWIWGLLFDDRRAIFQTIWESYPVVRVVIGVLIFIAALWFGLRWWVRRAERMTAGLRLRDGQAWRVGAVACFAVLFIFGIRGSLGRRPIQLKDAAVCGDPVLDKLVLNPISALNYSISVRLKLEQAQGLTVILPGGDIVKAANEFTQRAGAGGDLDASLVRVAVGRSAKKTPKHIFLVVMESYDSWPMNGKYAALHLTDRVASLGQRGILVRAFLPSANGTISSLGTIITGLPEAGVNANYRPEVRRGVPTAIASIFKRLGYRTRFFYGGYLSWQRLGEFSREQGFDEAHGGAEMAPALSGKEWGVDDQVLFRYITSNLGDKPSFNIVLSTSYHPPFNVDLDGAGCALKTLPPELSRYQATGEELRILGHHRYSDKVLGDFVNELSEKCPETLFAVTGDHWSRHSLDKQPTLYERRSVPLLLYGPKVLPRVDHPEALAGSHLDILPTLVELAAPEGFAYHAFGRNILDLSLPQIGYGVQSVITPQFILDSDSGELQDLAGKPTPPSEMTEKLRQRYRELRALGWWRILKGRMLPQA